MGFTTKISKADELFSLLVRIRDKWKCVRCGRQHEERKNTLDCSHFFHRASKSVRWDFDNCDSLCRYPCHQGSDSSDITKFGWEYQKQIEGLHGNLQNGAYTKFKIEQIGEDKFNQMLIRSHTPTKVDEKDLVLGFKLVLKEMERKKKSKIIGAR